MKRREQSLSFARAFSRTITFDSYCFLTTIQYPVNVILFLSNNPSLVQSLCAFDFLVACRVHQFNLINYIRHCFLSLRNLNEERNEKDMPSWRAISSLFSRWRREKETLQTLLIIIFGQLSFLSSPSSITHRPTILLQFALLSLSLSFSLSFVIENEKQFYWTTKKTKILKFNLWIVSAKTNVSSSVRSVRPMNFFFVYAFFSSLHLVNRMIFIHQSWREPMIHKRFGILKMNGTKKACVLVNLEVDVRISFDCHPWSRDFPWRLGCFACFCCCCMGCKVAKHLGETTIIGCLPCSIPYMRTKIRVARRIKVSCFQSIGNVFIVLWIILSGFMPWWFLCIAVLFTLYNNTDRCGIGISRHVGSTEDGENETASKWPFSTLQRQTLMKKNSADTESFIL